MSKVCIIGDSHAAALKKGWPSIEVEFSETRITFFAAGQTLYGGLKAVDGKLVATTKELCDAFEYTSGKLHAIAADYDFYLVCGLKLTPHYAHFVRKDYWARHGNGTIPVEVFQRDFPDAIAAELRKSHAALVLAMLRAITEAPIGMIATPRPHEFENEPEGLSQPAIARSRLLADAFETACRRIAEESGARFLPQPAETLTQNAMTSRSVFAARALNEEGEPDRMHKNAAYGAIVLRDALREMAAAAAPFRDATG